MANTICLNINRSPNAISSFQTYSSKDISFISIFAQNQARQGSEWSSQMSLEETEAMKSQTIGEGDGDAPQKMDFIRI